MAEVHVDLSPILRAINHLDERQHHLAKQTQVAIATVEQSVEVVQGDVAKVSSALAEFAEAFEAFRQADAKAKALHLAETRLVKVRQEIDSRFGHYAELRRAATGVLQAIDRELVAEASLNAVTENLLITTPNYWLAPTLVALASWVRNDPAVAERAMQLAWERDRNKVALFYGLLYRRAARDTASTAWIRAYFDNQNPDSLDREFVVMLDAVANGVFGNETRGMVYERVRHWCQSAPNAAEFAGVQARRWLAILNARVMPLGKSEFAGLRRLARAWPEMERSLAIRRIFAGVVNLFDDIVSSQLVVPPTLLRAVDEILDKLVTRFDDEELELRGRDRLYSLIVDHDGDEPVAKRIFQQESAALQEKTDFFALLANAAAFSESADASVATKRLATAISRDWILDAAGQLATEAAASLPKSLTFNLESWSGNTADGSNAEELRSDISSHFDGLAVREIAEVKPTTGWKYTLFVGLPICLIVMASGYALEGLVALGCVGAVAAYLYKTAQDTAEATKQRIRAEREVQASEVRTQVSEACQDLLTYLAEFASKQTDLDELKGLLSDLDSADAVDQVTVYDGKSGQPEAAPARSSAPVATNRVMAAWPANELSPPIKRVSAIAGARKGSSR